MFKNLIYLLFILGFIVTLTIGCESDITENPNVNDISSLLTNDSSKIWLMSMIINQDSLSIIPPSCLRDDERKFIVNKTCMTNNMGTIYVIDSLFAGPPHCIDTIQKIDTVNWDLNSQKDVLTIFGLQHNILKLTNDTLVLRTEYFDSVIQTEYYIAKKE
jgi:hypothetical protein